MHGSLSEAYHCALPDSAAWRMEEMDISTDREDCGKLERGENLDGKCVIIIFFL